MWKYFNKSLPKVKNTLFHEVVKGDSLSVIFEEKEIPLNTAYQIFNFDKNNLLSSIKPGDKMEFNYVNEDIVNIEIIKDKINSILIDLSDGVSIQKLEKKIQNIKSFKKGIISSSFYQDALKVGVPDSIIMDFAYIFGWDIDFIFDVRKGDSERCCDVVTHSSSALHIILSQGKGRSTVRRRYSAF